MAEIIDLDFYRKFRIILPVRLDSLQPRPLSHDKLPQGAGHQSKHFRRRRKLSLESKATKKDL